MIVAGFGFRSAASAASLRDALSRTGMMDRIGAVASVADKAKAAPFQRLAKDLALPVHCVSQAALIDAETESTSAVVLSKRQTGSVAEAAALVAAGPGARLLCARVVSGDRMAICAIATSRNEGETE